MKGWSKLVLESDSTYVISLFQDTNLVIPWKFKANWDWLQKKIKDIEFVASHVYREGNAVTDAISAYDTREEYIWWEDIPDFILNLAAKDRYMKHFRFC